MEPFQALLALRLPLQLDLKEGGSGRVGRAEVGSQRSLGSDLLISATGLAAFRRDLSPYGSVV
jgi:hypothetical protein